MLGRLGTHQSNGVEAFATSPTRNLMKFSRTEDSRFATIVFTELRKKERFE